MSIPAPVQPSERRGSARLLRRRRLLLWSAVPALPALCAAAKLLSLGLLAPQALTAFEARDAAAVEAAAGGLQVANVVEPHKAPFAAGTARALAGDFPAARLRFEEALAAVPSGSADECIVRVNLSLAIEKNGDDKLRTEGPASAAVLFAEALGVVEGAPEGCLSGDSAAEAGQQLARAEGRLSDRLAAAAEPAPPRPEAPQDDAPVENETRQRSQLEQLEEDSRQAQRERNAGREREDYLEDDDDGTRPDRPW